MTTNDQGLQLIQDNLEISCEFWDSVSVTKRRFWIFKKKVNVQELCGAPARWVVEFTSNICQDHEHVSILCDIHRHKLMSENQKFDKIQCTEDTEVVPIEKLQILSVSTI